MKELDRRTTLKLFGLTTAALWAGQGLAQQRPTADLLVKGKNPKLRVLSERPVVLETPLDLLGQYPETTPKEILFIRNNAQGEPPGSNTVEPSTLEGWKIEFGGLLDKPFTVEGPELLRLPQQEVTMVLQCSGNGRSFFKPQASGNPWTYGGMGNVTFRGPRLKDLLAAKGAKPGEKALYITAHAVRREGMAEFVKSVPLYALENAILALSMNGEPLPAVHGGPVRLVIPGFYGVNNVKWLAKVEFTEGENTTAEQIPRYRVPHVLNTRLPFLPTKPGETYKYTFTNSRSNWFLAINSFILSPLAGQTVQGPYVRLEGVAFNHGLVPLTSVEVSANEGRTWFQARLEKKEATFGWVRWRTVLYLRPGEHEVMVRATDAMGNTQPLDGNIAWNERGYEWNGVMRVRFTVA